MLPTDARSQLRAPVRIPPAAATQPLATPPAPVPPERDAFAPRAEFDEEPHPQVPSPPPVTPPRLARTLPALLPARSPSRVTAIATGTHPTAIIERDGDPPRLVTVGDAIDGAVVESIDDDAVVLSNGRRLSLEPPAGTR